MNEPSAKSREEAGKGASFDVTLYTGDFESVKHIMIKYHIKHSKRNAGSDRVLNAQGCPCSQLVCLYGRSYLLEKTLANCIKFFMSWHGSCYCLKAKVENS